jgi:hypothetical protein
VIGDQLPIRARILPANLDRISVRQRNFPPLPNPLPPDPPPGDQVAARSGVGIFAPNIRALKVAENMSPFPQDRIFGSFNLYENVGEEFNERDGAPFTNLRVYTQFYGFEKTFLDGEASLGLRMPINSLVVDSRVPGTGGTFTAAGDLNVFAKALLAQTEWSDGRLAALSGGVPDRPTVVRGIPGVYGIPLGLHAAFHGDLLPNRPGVFPGIHVDRCSRGEWRLGRDDDVQ